MLTGGTGWQIVPDCFWRPLRLHGYGDVPNLFPVRQRTPDMGIVGLADGRTRVQRRVTSHNPGIPQRRETRTDSRDNS